MPDTSLAAGSVLAYVYMHVYVCMYMSDRLGTGLVLLGAAGRDRASLASGFPCARTNSTFVSNRTPIARLALLTFAARLDKKPVHLHALRLDVKVDQD